VRRGTEILAFPLRWAHIAGGTRFPLCRRRPKPRPPRTRPWLAHAREGKDGPDMRGRRPRFEGKGQAPDVAPPQTGRTN